ncbi:glycosyltransferase [Halorubrum halophilum]|uniref:glycosyltransferase n=1 Tax=Halorubrum halophilum TaxID=413816 RepID=UPI00186B312E|nr:glycosyltransferase [Halorubrum halophilum]
MGSSNHIAFFLPSFQIGGIERVTITLAEGLDKQGYQVEIVVSETGGPLQDEVPSSIPVVDLNKSENSADSLISHLPELVDYFNDSSPSAIFSEHSHGNILLVLSRVISQAETQVIVRENGLSPYAPPGTMRYFKEQSTRLIASAIYRKANKIIPVSDGVEQDLLSLCLPRHKIYKINNPVVTDDLLTKADKKVTHDWFEDPNLDVILSVGRLEPRKGFTTLLESFSQLDSKKGIRLVIIGNGPEYENLKQMSQELGIEDKVWLPGFVDNPYKYMTNASVFVLSSTSEGLPTVLIEALASGCPVVSTDCPHGPAEILNEGEIAPLVEPNDPDALSNAISSVLENPQREGELKSRANDFRPESIIQEYDELVSQLI